MSESEFSRVCQEYGIDIGKDARLSVADRRLMENALRLYGEHLLQAASTVRETKVSQNDAVIASNLHMVSQRANLLASMIELSTGTILERCGQG